MLITYRNLKSYIKLFISPSKKCYSYSENIKSPYQNQEYRLVIIISLFISTIISLFALIAMFIRFGKNIIIWCSCPKFNNISSDIFTSMYIFLFKIYYPLFNVNLNYLQLFGIICFVLLIACCIIVHLILLFPYNKLRGKKTPSIKDLIKKDCLIILGLSLILTLIISILFYALMKKIFANSILDSKYRIPSTSVSPNKVRSKMGIFLPITPESKITIYSTLF